MKLQLKVLILLLCLGGISYAQDAPSTSKWAAKVSNEITFGLPRIRDSNGNTIGGAGVSFFNPRLGAMLRRENGDFWEFTLRNIGLNVQPRRNASPDFRPYNWGLDVKVGYFYTFLKSKTCKVRPMLGLELAPFVGSSQYQLFYYYPAVTLSPYRIRTSSFGVAGYLTPRVMWTPRDRWFLDASLNLGFGSVQYFTQTSTEPQSTRFSNLSYSAPWYLGLGNVTLGFGFKL